MTYVLTVSSQGQIVIPSKVRRAMGLAGGDKVKLRLEQKQRITTATIEPTISWSKRVAGIAKGVYGKGEEFIENERKTWDR